MHLPLRIAMTAGEPAGIGPDLVVQIAQQAHAAEVVVIADPDVLLSRAQQLHLPLHLLPCDLNQVPELHPAGTVKVLPVALRHPVIPGALDQANANYVLKTLIIAGEGCLRKQFAAVVTGPVHKGIINQAGIAFRGHTEFFADLTQTPRVVMMLATPQLRVALATTHLPLMQVAQAITSELLDQTITILHAALCQQFQIPQPKIIVCGLNPHAGEGGYLGREEIDVIEPVLNQLRTRGLQLVGPIPADTVFTPAYLTQADAILAMYHDQGLPVLKYQGFGQAINISLGLPIIRTSVDHGTALPLAGTGRADAGSLLAALHMAIQLASIDKKAT